MDVNLEAFRFIEFLKPFDEKREATSSLNKNLKGEGTEPIAHLGEIKNFGIDRFSPIDGKIVSKYKDVDGQLIGLNQEIFTDFSQFLMKLFQLELFKGKCDFNFLIDYSFEWLISVYTNKSAKQNLLSFLLDKLEDETQEYVFYYKFDGLAIESDFYIGNAKVVYISEQEIEKLVSNKENPIDEISLYEDLKGINVRVSITSTYGNSKNLALIEAELAVDTLKCFLAKYSIHRYYVMPDLKHRGLNTKNHSYYIFKPEKDIPYPQFQNFSGFVPLALDNDFLEDAYQKKFKLFSDFIIHKYQDELYLEIIAIIKRFAQIVSTFSNHEKIVKIIFLLEGAIMSRTKGGRSFGESKIKNDILPKLTTTQLDLFKKVIRKSYEIRDAYVHNSQEFPIEEQTIWVALEIVRVFTTKLIELHRSGKREFENIAEYFVG